MHCRLQLLLLNLMKKRSERRKHCALAVVKAEPKIFAPLQTPFSGAQDGQNLTSWRQSLPLPINPVYIYIDARNFELSW